MESPTSPDPENDFVSDEEFEAWMRAHPENTDYFVELIARAEKGEFGEVPAEMRDMVQMVLAKHKAAERVRAVQRLMQEFFTELRHVHGGADEITAETLAGLNARCNEVVDAALDIPEPHRAEVLRELLPLRDSLRRIGE
ncbi:hypothetical protein ACXR0O_26835 [Verrucomicrobiota bacterium sgz303538]